MVSDSSLESRTRTLREREVSLVTELTQQCHLTSDYWRHGQVTQVGDGILVF